MYWNPKRLFLIWHFCHSLLIRSHFRLGSVHFFMPLLHFIIADGVANGFLRLWFIKAAEFGWARTKRAQVLDSLRGILLGGLWYKLALSQR